MLLRIIVLHLSLLCVVSLSAQPAAMLIPATEDTLSMAHHHSACDSLDLYFDPHVVRLCNSEASTKKVSRIVSATMIPFSLGIPLALYADGYANHDPEMAKNGIGMFCADVGSLAFSFLVKNIVQRKRPYTSYPDCIDAEPEIDPYSFPSGHATGATVMAVYMSMRYPKWYVIVPGSAYALYTWYARMNLGVHYPSDVLVGALIGAAGGVLTSSLTDALAKRVPKLLPSAGMIAPGGGPRISVMIPL